jgi:drug/metabolite transporter (DMT)-like permease
MDRTTRVQIGWINLRGWRAKLLLYAVVTLIASIPAACAFFAYAEGGTSLWGAVGYSAAIYGGFGLYLGWDLMRERDSPRPGDRGGELGEDR